MNQITINSITEIDPVIIERINHLSGAHAALFWDVLYGTSESIIAIKNTEAVLDFLYYSHNTNEAFVLIRAYYELLGIDWPEELLILEQSDELKELLIYEFLQDADDIINDLKYYEH